MKLKIILFFVFGTFFLSAQQSFQFSEKINWNPQLVRNSSGQSIQSLRFDQSFNSADLPGIAIYKKEFEVIGNGELKVRLNTKAREGIQSTDLKATIKLHKPEFYITAPLI